MLSAGGLVVDAARQKTIAVDEETVILFDTSGLDDRDRKILDVLSREGPMGVSELARRLGISKSVVSRKLRKLAEMGLVEKNVVDGRPVYAVKTG
jgi:CRISPR locus-related DNA-binding protein